MSNVAIEALKQHIRSNEKVRMVREVTNPDGTIRLIDAWLPIGRGWNQGHGVTDWINNGAGWRTYDEYHAEKHKAEVAAKRDADADGDTKKSKVK